MKEKNETTIDRRIQLLLIDPIFLVNMFKEGMRLKENYQVVKGIPENALLIGTTVDHATGGMVLAIWCEDFKLISETEKFPMIKVGLKQD